MAESDEKRCPHCAEVIKKEARVCRYCGRDLTPKPYRPPIWSNRPPPYWKEEVKKRAWNAVVAYHAIPTVIGLAIGLAIYLPGAISGCRSSQEFSIFYSLDKRIGRGEELSDVELKEYFERLSDRYGYRIATENSRVNEDIKAWVKKIDDETHTVWINSENWDNQFFRHLSFIQNMAMYFFQKDPQTIPYCTIRSIEDDSVVATTRGMVNWEILRKKHQVQKGD